MSRTGNEDPERENVIGMSSCFSPFPSPIPLNVLGGHPNQPPLGSVQPSQGETNFGDSSGPLFTMYSKIGEGEDNQTAERWQKDADGIVIFVCPEVAFLHTEH